MKKNVIAICIALLMISCDNNTKETGKTVIVDELANTETPLVEEELCFRNEVPAVDAPDIIDVEDLKLTIKGDSVHGTLNWIPAEKGGMSGQLLGIRKGNIIEAVYDEINSDAPISIQINLSADEAVVTSTDEGFGSFTIKKSACK